MSAEQDIQTGIDRIWTSDFVQKNPKKSYQQYHPDEYNRVKAYVEGGAEPTPWPTTLLGDGLALVERGRRGVSQPEPEPEPEPQFTYRFATYNPSTDKITGCLNRFQPANSWWVPGTPETGAAWPDGGGIHPVSHPTYGPGFKVVSTNGMQYPMPPFGNPNSINCRNAVDPGNTSFFPAGNPLKSPVSGSTHSWEATFMRPSGYNWPSGQQHESLWEMFATHNGFDAVYHHLFLSNGAWAAGFRYYLAIQTLAPTESPPQANLWQRHVCPIEFRPDEYHTVRWSIKWSSPGVANGSVKASTSVNGGPFAAWLDLPNVTTKLASFQNCYGAAQVGLRAPLNSGPLCFHAYNLGVTIT